MPTAIGSVPPRPGNRKADASTATRGAGHPIGPDFAWADQPVFHPALAPDGRRCAYVRGTCETDRARMRTDLMIVDLPGGRETSLPGGGNDLRPAFSPSGRTLAFLRPDAAGERQLWLGGADGGDPRQLTFAGLDVAEFGWSPGGDALVYSADAASPAAAPRARAGAPAPVRVVRGFAPRLDAMGWRDDRLRQVFLIQIDGGGSRQLTAEAVDCRAPVWSPDGRKVAFIRGRLDAYTAPPGEPVSSVQVIPLGQKEARTWSVGLSSVCTLAWSPDSRRLVALASEDTSVPAHIAGQLYLLQADAAPVRLTDDAIRPAGGWPPLVPPPALHWLAAEQITFLGERRGCTHLLELQIGQPEIRTLRGGRRVVADAAFDATGQAAVLLEMRPESPGTLVWWTRRGHRARDLAANGRSYLMAHPPAPMRRFNTLVRTCPIESRLLMPPWVGDGGCCPLIVDLHGGPHAAFQDAFLPLQQILATHGFAVLAVNPRGSTGYGREFLKAIHGRWGQVDCADILAVLERVKHEAPVDPRRIGLLGISYGGCLAAHLLAAAEFQAAVLISPVVDLIGMHDTADIGIPYCTVQMRGSVSHALGRYLRSSPLFRAGQVHGAVLLMHGEEDRRCPIAQSEAYYAALQDRGCPVELVRFPGCSHTLGLLSSVPPGFRQELFTRTLAWFERQLCGRGTEVV